MLQGKYLGGAHAAAIGPQETFRLALQLGDIHDIHAPWEDAAEAAAQRLAGCRSTVEKVGQDLWVHWGLHWGCIGVMRSFRGSWKSPCGGR